MTLIEKLIINNSLFFLDQEYPLGYMTKNNFLNIIKAMPSITVWAMRGRVPYVASKKA